MRDLKLVGLSADGRRVVFVDDTGAEFGAPADDRLRAALRGDRARLGQLEIEMDSVLRPRDIQSRIRAGETPDAVAALAQVSVEKIMPYCVPVLAERSHVATLARRSSVRRKNAEGPARSLGDLVAERLRGRGVDPAATEWDAWRRDDGRWQISVHYRSGERPRAAMFVFDSAGRYAVADDDEAKWLTGERQSTSKGPQPREAAGRGEAPATRRLAAVPAGDDLLSLADEETTDDLTAVVRAVREDEPLVADAERSAGPHRRPETQLIPTEPEVSPVEEPRTVAEAVDAPAVDVRASEPHAVEAPPAEATVERRRRSARRASVPSWDEIMFGRRKDQ